MRPRLIDQLRLVVLASSLLALCGEVRAGNVCGLTDSLDFSGMSRLPFGGETLGLGPSGGEIIGATFDVTFTATGQFNAADLGIFMNLNLTTGGASFGFTGAQLGWAGQGTFTAHLESANLNGYIESFGNPFSTWFLDTINFNPGNGPLTGSFNQLVFKLTYGPCPIGDINHDASVNVDDLLAVINAWGACAVPSNCPADVTGNGTVNVDDLLAVINHWGNFCPNCK